jgi:hypothetical protein
MKLFTNKNFSKSRFGLKIVKERGLFIVLKNAFCLVRLLDQKNALLEGGGPNERRVIIKRRANLRGRPYYRGKKLLERGGCTRGGLLLEGWASTKGCLLE